MSLWHKIFGSPAEQTAKFVDTPAAEAQDVSFRAFREEPISEIEETQYGSEAREGIGGDDSRDHVDHVEHDLDTAHPPSDDSEQKRGRSRRRRRGGRGRKQGDQRNAATRESTPREIHEAGEDFDDLGVTDTDDDGADPSLDDPFASEDIPEGAADDSDLSRSKAAQRAIPSWDEAIGYIVDCNMQERSQRRPAPRSQSRGASSRGRSRGSRNNHNNNK